MIKKADKHNFSQSVFQKNGKIFKPRCLVWEYLFLSKKSGLRNILHSLLGDNLTLPDLNFEIDWQAKNYQGFVENLEVLNNDFDHNEIYNIGLTLGIFCFFGVTDLHKDNIIFGKAKKNSQFVFTPIDIESLLTKAMSLKDLSLLPHGNEHYYGLSLIEGFEELSDEKIAKFCLGLSNSISTLIKNEKIFNEYFNDSLFNKCPVRVIPRKTQAYFDHLSNNRVLELNYAEKIQIEREDIPYFFKYISSEKIYHYDQNFAAIEVLKKDIDLWLSQKVGLNNYFSMSDIASRASLILRVIPRELAIFSIQRRKSYEQV